MNARREIIQGLRTPFLMLHYNEQESLLHSCETMYSFNEFGHRYAAEMPPDSIQGMGESMMMKLESSWMMFPHHPLQGECAMDKCGTHEP